ncbi:hypothetical protein ABZX90_38465 [Streptomyces sp. NPDC002935]|uniref:hypothetical protein n=1 Tax=Streptomyces sp. NPDC002935 TaxID=3154545 RepID=UPI0033A47651
MNALKVGVAIAPNEESRLREHARRGWTTELCVQLETGHQALQAERAVLGFLRTCGVTHRVPQEDMPQGGYTETIARADLTDLNNEDLVRIAELAGRLVRRAYSPPFEFIHSVHDAIGGIQELIEEGHKEHARELMEVTMSCIQEFMQKLGLDPL